MKRFVLLFSCTLLAACLAAPDEGGENGASSSSASSSSSLSSSSSVASEDDLPPGDFRVEDGIPQGTAYVRGYATIEEVEEFFCEEDCATFDYVFFHVLETGSEEFSSYIETHIDNSFVGRRVVGLGCREGNAIRYANHSDARGMRSGLNVDADVAAAILSSTERDPVTLALTKLPLSGGTEAPNCYSHFTEIEAAHDVE